MFRADLPKIDVPTLVVHGTEDRILPFESTAARLRDEKLIADLEVVPVEGGPHNIGWNALRGAQRRVPPLPRPRLSRHSAGARPTARPGGWLGVSRRPACT